jgi:hypothetical protein
MSTSVLSALVKTLIFVLSLCTVKSSIDSMGTLNKLYHTCYFHMRVHKLSYDPTISYNYKDSDSR